MPTFEDLAARDDVTVRRTRHEVDDDRFASVSATIADGFTWAVGAIVTDEDGRVVLVREDGQWVAPGGKVESGETHEEALVREFREETGLRVSIDDLVAVTEVTFVHDDSTAEFYFAHYTATPRTTALSDEPGRDGEAIEAVRWLETIPDETLDREVVVANRKPAGENS